jgi:hypothetical protein
MGVQWIRVGGEERVWIFMFVFSELTEAGRGHGWGFRNGDEFPFRSCG